MDFLFLLNDSFVFFIPNAFPRCRTPFNAGGLQYAGYGPPASFAAGLDLVGPDFRNSITPEARYGFRIRCLYLSASGTAFFEH